MAQGTIRPISERAYFMVFRELFDLDAFPYRALAFLTQFGNLILLNLIARRLTGSAVVGFLAAMLWCSNSVLFWPLSWTSAYNQILCAFVLLLALYLFLRYAETGQRKYYYWQWIVFLIGFGVLEENVVYPALALVYAFFFARKYVWQAAWLAPASILYAIAHQYFAKSAHKGIYAMEVGAKTLPALLQYWTFSIWPSNFESPVSIPAMAILTIALLAYLLWRGRNEPVALFALAWFLITVAPYLLVPNHISDYYLVVPTIGLALFAANALHTAWGTNIVLRIVVVILTALHVLPSAYMAWTSCLHARTESTVVKNLVLGVDQLTPNLRNKNIFLAGIDNQLFSTAIYHHPFRLLGMTRVYVTPEDAAKLQPWQGIQDFSSFSLPANSVLHSLENGSGVALRFDGQRLTNITPSYREQLSKLVKADGPPRRIDPGLSLFDEYLTSGWYLAEQRHRWMSQRVVLLIGNARNPGESLHVACSCAEIQQRDMPFTLTATIAGKRLPPVKITQCGTGLDFSFPLPKGNTELLEVVLELDKTSKIEGDKRPLGLAVQRIEIR